MKKLITLIVCISIFQIANAQIFKFGLKAGLVSTSIKMDDLDYTNNVGQQMWTKAGDAKFGVQFGALARIKIAKFYVQPEVLFTSTSAEVKIKELLKSTDDAEKQKFNKIDIPINVGLKLGPVRIQAGPIASFMLTNKSALDIATDTDTDLKDELKKAVWGYQAGVGLDFWKLGIDVRYEGSLSKYSKIEYINNLNTDTKTKQWVFTIAYYFGDN